MKVEALVSANNKFGDEFVRQGVKVLRVVFSAYSATLEVLF